MGLHGEVELLASLDHANIVKMYSALESDSHLYLALEYMAGGDLCDCICTSGHFEEVNARIVFRQVSEAIMYLHECNIVHRDLKVENVLLSSRDRAQMIAKLADFGLSRLSPQSHDCSTYCGTYTCVAPEIAKIHLMKALPSGDPCLEAAGWTSGYGKSVDLWSLGVLLYVVLSGVPPFDPDGCRTISNIARGLYEFDVDVWETVSSQGKDMVSSLMQVEPGKRLSLTGVLEHDWFSV